MKRVRIRVYGDVQGVFYRHFAKETAEKIGVNGWIRNDPDGTVFIVAEGDDKKVEQYLEWAKEGSPMAQVEKVDFAEEEYLGDTEGFEIR
jgi:acylphosphatase